MTFDYKKYSLEQLNNWMHDAISSAEATPQEIYDVIKGVVEEQYHYFKLHTGRCYELLTLLNNNSGQSYEDVLKERDYYEPSMPPWGHSDLEYMIANPSQYTEEQLNAMCDKAASDEEKEQCQEYNLREAEYYDNKKKWVLPVELDGPSGEYFVTFPEDLQQVSGIHAGDEVQWIDNKDGSYTLRKVIK